MKEFLMGVAKVLVALVVYDKVVQPMLNKGENAEEDYE